MAESNSPNPILITRHGYEVLKKEYETLVKIERPQVVETVAWAASNGDRSENGDYIYGKKRLREIDKRIRFLSKRFEAFKIVDPKQIEVSDTVTFGATVVLQKEDESQVCYQLVGVDEINIDQGQISTHSPLGKALLNKKLGDEVNIRSPKGEIWFEIISIEYR